MFDRYLIRPLVLALLITTASWAQTNSNTQVITLTAAVEESLTVSVDAINVSWSTSGGNALIPGSAVNPGDVSVTATTTWRLRPSRTSVSLWAFFGSSAAALAAQDVDNTVDIPSSAIQIRCTGADCLGGGSFQPVSNTGPAGFGVAGAALELQSTTISPTNLVNNAGSVATLDFNIDLSSGAMQTLPADTYVGSLTIQAQALP